MVTSPQKERLLPVLLFIVILTGIHLAGFFFPSALTWGFNELGFLPWQFCLLCSLIVIVGTALIVRGNVEPAIMSASRFMERYPLRFLLISIATVVSLGIVFRVHVPLLGDGFYIVKNFSEAARGIAPLYPRDEPLATYYFSALFNTIGIPNYEQFLTAYLIADLLLAAGFIINVFMIVRTIFTDAQSRLLAFVLLLAISYMQLFFGYVETYAAVLFALSLWINIAVSYLYKKIPFVAIPVMFLLMALTHYLTLLMIPSLLFLAWTEFKRNKGKQLITGFGIVAVITLIILFSINFDIENYTSKVPYSHILSVTKSNDTLENYAQAYTMFSWYHLADILNFVLLLCPFSILVLAFMRKRLKQAITSHPPNLFLTVAVVPVIMFFCIVKFDLGAARDWDVFSSYTVILALLTLSLFFAENRLLPTKLFSLIIFITILHSALFWYVNSTTDATVKRYQSFFDTRTLSQNGFYGASLQLSMYYHQINNTSEPSVVWQKYISLFPNDERGYTNIIANLREGPDDSLILHTFAQWRTNNPHDTTLNDTFLYFCLDAGKRSFEQKKYAQAESCYRYAIAIDSTYSKPFNNLGSVLAVRGKLGEALSLFQHALSLDSTYSDALYNIGNMYIDTGKKKQGIDVLQRAARMGNQQAQHDLREQKIVW